MRSLDTIEFLDTHVCINNPYWQSSGIIISLCKCYIVNSDTLLGASFLGMLFLLVAEKSSELYEKPKRNKDWVTKKKYIEELMCGHQLFNCTPSFLCYFLLLSSSTTLSKGYINWMVPIKVHIIAMGGILCDVEYMKISCNLILADWHL